MHKVRVYVMPEVEEEKPEDVTIDDFDSSTELPATPMQRKNSRRPSGALRLNVIQKDRRNDSLTPKLKQIRQQLAKNDTIQNKIDQSISSVSVKNNIKNHGNEKNEEYDDDNNNNNSKNNNNNNDNDRNIINKNNNNHEENIKTVNDDKNRSKIGKNRSKIENEGLFLNSKGANDRFGFCDNGNGLKKSVNNIEKIGSPISVLNFVGNDVTPRKIIRNDSMFVGAGLLSPIFEISLPISNDNGRGDNAIDENDFGNVEEEEIGDFKRINSVNNVCSVKVNSDIVNGLNENDNKNLQLPRSNDTNTVNGNNSVILRRNNKLNRYREYDLEQKIEVEIKMREGSARLLAAARHRAQSLEAARALLTSNERMSAYMAELQRRKRESSNKPSLPTSTARVSLSDLRVPLMWRDSDHFKNRGDYRRFAVFCLARVGTEIHDTALLCPVDRALTDVTFPDVLVFNNVPPDFEVTLEIYSHILQEDLSIASTPRRIKRSIHSSISRTVGKKLAASLRDELNSGKIGPHFELMASARLTLDDTDDNIHTHDLVLNNLENKTHSLPLFGHFCCRLAAQPECVNEEACSGNVVIDGRKCWARIQGFKLQAWDSRKLAEEEQNPWSTVPINRETLIQPSKSSSKELRISNTIDGSDKITTIRLETADETQKWVRQLVAHAKDHSRWRHAAEIIQDVPSVESARNSFIGNKRQGSLYDETPLIESVQSDYTASSQQRPTVQEIFGLTTSTSLSSCSSSSSPPSLRSRSLSTSGVRKSGTNTLRSHWPFSNKNQD